MTSINICPLDEVIPLINTLYYFVAGDFVRFCHNACAHGRGLYMVCECRPWCVCVGAPECRKRRVGPVNVNGTVTRRVTARLLSVRCVGPCVTSECLVSLISLDSRALTHAETGALPHHSVRISLSGSCVWSFQPLRPSSYERGTARSPQPLSLLISVSQAHPSPAIYFCDSFL